MYRFFVEVFLLIIISQNYYLSSGYRETRNNYCSKIVSETEQVVIPETKRVLESYKAFCWTITLTCTKHRYKTVKINKTVTFTKTKRVKSCCPGYEKENDSCVPMCKLGCGHGECVEPDICLCDPGWREPLCLNECEPNRYGRGCNDNCSCLNGGECDQETGYCYCPAGYRGDSCELPCEEGAYGKNCEKECKCENDAECDIVDGTCECLPGYEGDFCEKPCKAGTHGENCENLCICIPENTHLCDHIDGKCKCRPGYKGEYCEKECDNMTYGPECRKKCNCVHSEYCDNISGKCICKAGWIGATCSERCPFGMFGDNCSFQCTQCLNEMGTCDHVTGECSCPPGFYGDLCDKDCLPGYWGPNCSNICSCDNKDLCNTQDGKCYSMFENDDKTAGYFQDGTYYLYIIIAVVLPLVSLFAVGYTCYKTSIYKPFYSLYMKSRLMSRIKSMPETVVNNPVYNYPEVVLDAESIEGNHIRGSYSSGVKFFKNKNYDAATEEKLSNIEQTKDVPEAVVEKKRDSKDSDSRKSKILNDLTATFKEMKRCSMRKSNSAHSSTNQLDEDFQPEVLDDFNTIENIYGKTIEEKKENIYDTPQIKEIVSEKI